MLQRLFQLSENHTDVKTEIVAGIRAFMALPYIIFVQPTVPSACGMDCGAVLMAACAASAIAAFLTMVIMPFAFSITEGIAFGFISYALLKTVTGRGREVHILIYVFAVLFVIRYIFIK
jgi:adenine/guanine/hypoxanthine permease